MKTAHAVDGGRGAVVEWVVCVIDKNTCDSVAAKAGMVGRT